MKWFTVEGNRQKMDGGAIFGNAPKALWSKWVEPDANNGIELACRCLVVKSDDCVALVDAALGPFMEPKYASRYGIDGICNRLVSNLEDMGVSEEDVTHILLSHLHFDHAGGLLPAWPAMQEENWKPLFPNARYVVAKEQYERSIAPHPRDRASFVPGYCEHLERTGRLVLLDSPEQPVPGLAENISFLVSNGHTPGLLQALVKFEEETVFFASDMIPGIPWVHLPISTSFDRNPELLINEKKAVLDRAIREDWIVVYVHDPDTPASRIMQNADTGKYEARPL